MNGCGEARSELRRGNQDDHVQKSEWWCGMGREWQQDVVGH